MMNIEALCGQLHVISERVNSSITNLERERNYILESMDKAQTNFGGQRAGQQLVTELYHSINSIAAADSSLNALRIEICNYMNQIKR